MKQLFSILLACVILLSALVGFPQQASAAFALRPDALKYWYNSSEDRFYRNGYWGSTPVEKTSDHIEGRYKRPEVFLGQMQTEPGDYWYHPLIGIGATYKYFYKTTSGYYFDGDDVASWN